MPATLDMLIVGAAVAAAVGMFVRQVAGVGRPKSGCKTGCGSCAASQPAPNLSSLVQIGRKPLSRL